MSERERAEGEGLLQKGMKFTLVKTADPFNASEQDKENYGF